MRSGRILLCPIFCSLFILFLSCKKDEILVEPGWDFFPKEGRIVKIIAHRGYWDTEESCQNSITSIIKAVEIGADGVECDLWKTADDSIVVNHDADYSGKKISSSKYHTLEAIPLPNGEVFPTFRNYLRTIKLYPSMILFIEIKDSKVTKPLLSLLSEEKPKNPIVFISFSKGVCDELIKTDSRLRVQLLRHNEEFVLASELMSEGYFGIAYSLSLYNQNPLTITDANSCGACLTAWTLTDTKQYDWLFENNFQFAITDTPNTLIERSKTSDKYWYNTVSY